jgi:hypothetical protein
MKYVIEEWLAEDLYRMRHLIQYPDYQREPSVWNDEKKRLLIDSMFIGLDIPKIYLYKQEGSENYDCVDGQQRIRAVIEFFDGQLTTYRERRNWNELSGAEQNIIRNYKFTIAVITEANDNELRLLFLRLQLGSPLNAGEKLHALTGDMRNFVFHYGKDHPFFQKVQIPQRRYAKETVFAQICINSFYLSIHKNFYRARYEDLKSFFEQYASLKGFKTDTDRIKITLDKLDSYFGENAKNFGNRASIVSAYLFFEELIKNGEDDKLMIFVEFYLKFLETLEEQTQKGLDYDRKYRDLLNFQTYVTQASVEKYAIEGRHKILKDYFEYYIKNKKIKTS